MRNYKELEVLVHDWANDRGILEKATPLAQCSKTEEEVLELREALIAKNNELSTYVNSKGKLCKTGDEIKDALGDILVTIMIQSDLHNVNLVECLDGAYEVISKRKGVMKNGQFLKNEE